VRSSWIRGGQVGFRAEGTGDLERLVRALCGTYTLGPKIRLIGGLFYLNDEAETAAGPPAGLISDAFGTNGRGGAAALATATSFQGPPCP
jgi:hypothetical protein